MRRRPVARRDNLHWRTLHAARCPGAACKDGLLPYEPSSQGGRRACRSLLKGCLARLGCGRTIQVPSKGRVICSSLPGRCLAKTACCHTSQAPRRPPRLQVIARGLTCKAGLLPDKPSFIRGCCGGGSPRGFYTRLVSWQTLA